MHIAAGQWAYSPAGTKFWCQQKLLVTSIICCYFLFIDENSFWKIHCFSFFPYKSIRDQIWPCHKIGQDQPRVIIWINLVVLEHPMLHNKFQGHQPLGSGEEDFLRFFIINRHGGHLGHVTWTVWTNFRSPIPRRLHMKFSFNRPSGFRGEDVWKCWHTTHIPTHIHTDDRGL